MLPPDDEPPITFPEGVALQAVDPSAIERVDFTPPGNPSGTAFIAFSGTTITVAAVSCAAAPPADAAPILFVRDGDIWVVEPDGSNPRCVVDMPGPLYRPRWSPKMRRILCDDGNDLLYCDAAGGNVINLTDGASGHQVMGCWSPDGSFIAYCDDSDGDYEIWTMRADGNGARQITDNSCDDLWPIWSPDGRRLAFSSGDTNKDIYTVNLDGSRLINVTASEDFDEMQPSWSPDGRRLAFTQAPVGEESRRIATCAVDGGDLQVLTGANLSAETPAFSPDGRSLAFALLDCGDIFKMSVDGGEVENITWSAGSSSDPWWISYGSYRVVLGRNGADSGYDPPLGRSRELLIVALRPNGLASAVAAIAGGPAVVAVTQVSSRSPVPMIDISASSALRVWEDRGRGLPAEYVMGPSDAEVRGYITRSIIAFDPASGRISSVIPFAGNVTTAQAFSALAGDKVVLRGNFLSTDDGQPVTEVVLDANTGRIVQAH